MLKFQVVIHHRSDLLGGDGQPLGQMPPERVYQVSPRVWEGVLRSPDCPDHVGVRRVLGNGEIKWKSKATFISKPLRGEPDGLNQIDDNAWLLKYGPILLGTLKARSTANGVRPG